MNTIHEDVSDNRGSGYVRRGGSPCHTSGSDLAYGISREKYPAQKHCTSNHPIQYAGAGSNLSGACPACRESAPEKVKNMPKEFTQRDVESRMVRGIKLLDRYTPMLVSRNPEIWTFPSERESGTTYAVTEHDGLMTCSCEDYRYHTKGFPCKHIAAVAEFKKRNAGAQGIHISVPQDSNVSINISINGGRYHKMGALNNRQFFGVKMTKNVKSDTFCESIKTYIDAAYPLLLIESSEEDRACEKVRKLAATIPTRPQVFEWTLTSGFSTVEHGKRVIVQPAPVLNMALDMIEQRAISGNRPAIYILKDLHNLIAPGGNPEPSGVRKLRDLYGSVMRSPDTVILLSPEMHIPYDLQKQITVVDLPLPTEAELEVILRSAMTDASSRPDHAYDKTVVPLMNDEIAVHNLAQAGRGMSAIEFDNAIAKGFSMGSLTQQTMIQEKAQVIRKSGALRYIEPKVSPDMVGGLDAYKEWMATCVDRFLPEAREYGLEPPKGALLVGPPGTGKSMLVEMSAYMLKVAMFDMESQSIHSKWVGESARNMARSLKVAHSLTPCLLRMDEGEKMLGGTHEAVVQTKGVWLTDYEEHSDGMFTIMTCNGHTALSPEVLQRFERVWYVGPPSTEEREAIFAAKIRAIPASNPYDPADFDLQALASATPGFVGREIRTILKESLTVAFSRRERLETATVLDYIESANIVPTTVQRATEIAEMVAWAEKNASNASATTKAPSGEIGAMVKSRYKR